MQVTSLWHETINTVSWLASSDAAQSHLLEIRPRMANDWLVVKREELMPCSAAVATCAIELCRSRKNVSIIGAGTLLAKRETAAAALVNNAGACQR